MKPEDFDLTNIDKYKFASLREAKEAIKEVFGDDPFECGYAVDIFEEGDHFMVSYFNSES